MNNDRLSARFKALKESNKDALVTFVTAGDPNLDISQEILNGLPSSGADIIELGMPFSDPVADGPAIQLGNQRALQSGMSLIKTLDMVRAFRKNDSDTPIILMGYFNPIFKYGCEKFAFDAKDAGVDGLIIVDLPPEEDSELRIDCEKNKLHFIKLATPTTDLQRCELLLQNMSGFLYYVAVAGITGTKSADNNELKERVEFLKQQTSLPIAVGFGIKTPEQVSQINQFSDAAVVGSAIVNTIDESIKTHGNNDQVVNEVLTLVKNLSNR